MNSNFAIDHVLKAEGGYINHPADAGGPTNYGITLRTLSRWRGEACTAEDVKDLTEAEARNIYEEFFWRPTGLERIVHRTVAATIFDQVVNGGPAAAVRLLQRALKSTTGKSVTVDGVLGPATILEANAADPELLTINIVIEAQRRYLSLWKANPSQGAFLAGWLARTWRLLTL